MKFCYHNSENNAMYSMSQQIQYTLTWFNNVYIMHFKSIEFFQFYGGGVTRFGQHKTVNDLPMLFSIGFI